MYDKGKYLELRAQGKFFFQKKEYRNAVKSYSQAIDICRNDEQELAACLINRALCFMNLSEFEESIFDSTDAFALQPGNPKSLYVMGKSYELKGDLRNALTSFKKMLVVDPNSGEGKAGVSRLRAKVDADGIIDSELLTDLPPVPPSRRRTSLKFGATIPCDITSTESRTSSEDKYTPPARPRTNSVSDEIPAPRDGFPPMHPAVAFALEAANKPHESLHGTPSLPSTSDSREVYEQGGVQVDITRSAPPKAKQLRDVTALLLQHKQKKRNSSANIPQKVFAVPATWWAKWVEYVHSSSAEDTPPSAAEIGSPKRLSSRHKAAGAQVSSTNISQVHPLPGQIPIGEIVIVSKSNEMSLKPTSMGFDAMSVLNCPAEDTPHTELTGERKITAAPAYFVPTSKGSVQGGFIVVPEEVWLALESWYGADSALPLYLAPSDQHKESPLLNGSMFRMWTTQCDENILGMSASSGAHSSSKASTPLKSSYVGSNIASHFCAVCLDPGELRCSRCKAVNYCSATCQTCDWPYHKTRCKTAPKSLNATTSKAENRAGYFGTLGLRSRATVHASLLRATSRLTCRGMIGLANLGNSCYFNASLQCLSHSFPLTKYLISCQYEPHINKTSRDGTGGQLVKEYAALLREMWLKSFPSDELRPIALRRLIGRENEDYATLQQQDAHDVLVFLLDRLHEDVNLVLKKPYVENSEGNGDNDEEISQESWEKHRMRHNSVVQEIVGGQLRSQIVCPHESCNKKSITFEFASTVQLAIPDRNRVRSRSRSSSAGLYSYRMDRVNSRPMITIPVMVIPEIPTVGTTRDSNVPSISSFLHKLTCPLELKAEEDSLATISTLEKNLLKQLAKASLVLVKDTSSVASASVRARQEGSLLLVELEEAPERVMAAALTATSSTSAICRGWTASCLLSSTDNISAVISGGMKAARSRDMGTGGDEPVALAAYWKSTATSLSHNAFLIQRVMSPSSATTDDFRILGRPVLLSFDAKWSCSRLRFSIWKQISHLLRGQENFGVALPNGLEDIQKQMRMANRLVIRAVDRLGNPLEREFAQSAERAAKTASVVAVDEEEDAWATGKKLISRKSREGEYADLSLLPSLKTVTVAEFLGKYADKDEITFLAVDWVDGWLDFLDEDKAVAHMTLTGEGYVIRPIPPEVAATNGDSDSEDEECSSAASSPSKRASDPLVLKRHVPEGVITLEECLQMFTSEETLDEDNSWYCSDCKTHRQALKTMQFWSLPKILIIGLKRFETSAGGMMAQMYGSRYGQLSGATGGHREKISTFVDFPIKGLDLSPFCKKGRPRKSKRGGYKRSRSGGGSIHDDEDDDIAPDDPFIYDLYAVCNHYGRMGFGHYTAMARDWEGLPPSDGDETAESSNLWCSYDDDIVHVIDEKAVKTSAAYILFYRQRICK